MAAKRHKVGRARRSPKQRLLGSIRSHAAAATSLRLRGLVAGAMRYEEDVEREIARAETAGWGDEAAAAEERGASEGRAHAAKQ